jgi:microcystin-dependent protein
MGPTAIDATGVIKMFGGVNAPAGYLNCDGSAVSRVTFAALFAVIGGSFGGGDGSTTFNLPNFNAAGNFPRGGGPGAVGGGGHDHTLSDAGQAAIEMQATGAPNLYMRRVNSGSWVANIGNAFSGSFQGSTLTETLGAALRGATDFQTGYPPFVQVNFIIKT